MSQEERAHANRVEQLEGLRNVRTNADFYERLAAGKFAQAESENSRITLQYIPVPMTLKAQMGSPTALAIGAFATTLTTLSCSLMEWRGLTMNDAFIGNFLAVAGIGMVISANWELVLGNTYAYTVLSAFGFFYFGFGLISLPVLGVAASYGGSDTVQYYNAIGFFVLLWAVFNFFFLVGSLPLNLVYIGIFGTVQIAFTLIAAAYFLYADGHTATGLAVQKAGGAFGFASGMLGYYTLGNLMLAEFFWFDFPMGDTSHWFPKRKKYLPEKE